MFTPSVTVTVGIPAYNEAANIKYILQDILAQHEHGFKVEKIIVNSDGSTDDTVSLVRSLDDPRIEVINDGNRKGQAVRQNEIIQRASSDVLVLLNADIALDGRFFLTALIQPLINGKADFTSANMLSIEPQSMIEEMLAMSLKFKNLVFEHWNRGNNLYTCHGAARAFSRKYYEHFRFGDSVGEDAYSYFFGLVNRYKYAYAPLAVVRIKLPDNLKDHFKQSTRFFYSQTRLMSEFGAALVEHEYALPKKLFLSAIVLTGLRHPLLFPLYVLVTVYAQWKTVFQTPVENMWDMATSSKQLHS